MKGTPRVLQWLALSTLSILNLQLATAFAQTTAISYQGGLNDGAGPANGNYDLRFTVYDAALGGDVVTGPVTNVAVAVSNGLFTTLMDFGTGPGSAQPIWLDIAVRTNGSSTFTALTPRTLVTPVPLAWYANTASNLTGTLPASQLSGPIPATDVSGVVSTATNFTGSLNGDVTGTQNATVVLAVGGSSAANIHTAEQAANAATSLNTPGAIVARDAFGTIQAGNVYVPGILDLNLGTSSGSGVISFDGMYAYATGSQQFGPANFFVGGGNFTMTGGDNFGIGTSALISLTTGEGNVAYGWGTLPYTTTGRDNCACGYGALFQNINGNYNTAVGFEALGNCSVDDNIALGSAAGGFITTGTNNIDIGNGGTVLDTNVIRIGSSQAQTFIAGTINGNGGGLTNLSASQITRGTIPLAQLPAIVLTNGAANAAFAGTLNITNTVSGGGLMICQNDLSTSISIRNFVQSLVDLAVAHGPGEYSSDAQAGDAVLRASDNNQLILQSGVGSANIIISNGTTTVYGTFNNNSDRNAKEDFASLAPLEILDKVARLPLSEWSYKADAHTRHIGPMAQDFYAEFNVGTDEKHIAPIDEGGVALAAIQGLNEKVESKSQSAEARIQTLEAENAALRARLEKLEQLVNGTQGDAK